MVCAPHVTTRLHGSLLSERAAVGPRIHHDHQRTGGRMELLPHVSGLKRPGNQRRLSAGARMSGQAFDGPLGRLSLRVLAGVYALQSLGHGARAVPRHLSSLSVGHHQPVGCARACRLAPGAVRPGESDAGDRRGALADVESQDRADRRAGHPDLAPPGTPVAPPQRTRAGTGVGPDGGGRGHHPLPSLGRSVPGRIPTRIHASRGDTLRLAAAPGSRRGPGGTRLVRASPLAALSAGLHPGTAFLRSGGHVWRIDCPDLRCTGRRARPAMVDLCLATVRRLDTPHHPHHGGTRCGRYRRPSLTQRDAPPGT